MDGIGYANGGTAALTTPGGVRPTASWLDYYLIHPSASQSLSRHV